MGHEECERKIAALEQRVAQLKGLVRQLMVQQTAAAAPPAAQPGPVAAEKTPATAPAPEPPRHFEMPPELLPGIGKMGAQAGLLLSGALNP